MSGVYQLEDNRYRWISGARRVPAESSQAAHTRSVSLYIPDQASGRRVTVLVDGEQMAEATYPRAGPQQLASSEPVTFAAVASTVLIVEVDRTFSAPGDNRRLGIILNGVGFR